MRASKLTTCCPRGLTLIEVVAGLALMGTLLAGMLTAKSRFTRQQVQSQRVLIAVEALDALLIEHWDEFQVMQRGWHGDFDGLDDMSWRASFVASGAASDWHCRVIRIEVLDQVERSRGESLASVELLVPDPDYLKEIASKEGTEEDKEQGDSDMQELPDETHKQENTPALPDDKTEPGPVVLGVSL